jgi:hypothetical protein
VWQYTTNLEELKQMGVQPSPLFRHDVGGISGEFNYIAVSRGKAIDNWYNKNAWDYALVQPLPTP